MPVYRSSKPRRRVGFPSVAPCECSSEAERFVANEKDGISKFLIRSKTCSHGGTGRHLRLKISCPNGRSGSNPDGSTKGKNMYNANELEKSYKIYKKLCKKYNEKIQKMSHDCDMTWFYHYNKLLNKEIK